MKDDLTRDWTSNVLGLMTCIAAAVVLVNASANCLASGRLPRQSALIPNPIVIGENCEKKMDLLNTSICVFVYRLLVKVNIKIKLEFLNKPITLIPTS